MKTKGFTLIELLVVVLIIGILAAVALPQYYIAVERSRVATALPLFKSIRDAQMRYQMATGKETIDLDFLDIHVPYTSRQQIESSGVTRMRYNVDNSLKAFAVAPHAIYWGPAFGYVIDFYGESHPSSLNATAICYPLPDRPRAERVCQAFGRKTDRISTSGTPVYALQF